jgi:hypothetical protein
MADSNRTPVGAWATYNQAESYVNYDSDNIAIFGSEIQALRYANGRGLQVIRWQFGKTLTEAIAEGRTVVTAPAPVRARASRKGRQDDALPAAGEQPTREERNTEDFANAIERAATMRKGRAEKPTEN